MTSLALFDTNTYDFSQQLGSLVEAFGKLPKSIGKKHLGAALKRGAIPFAKVLRQATPRRSGGLRKSVKTTVVFYDKSNYLNAGARVQYGKGGYHAYLIEHGTNQRYTYKKFRAWRGFGKARHMMADTRVNLTPETIYKIETELLFSLDAALKEMDYRKSKGVRM